jgi:hypothetical protein
MVAIKPTQKRNARRLQTNEGQERTRCPNNHARRSGVGLPGASKACARAAELVFARSSRRRREGSGRAEVVEGGSFVFVRRLWFSRLLYLLGVTLITKTESAPRVNRSSVLRPIDVRSPNTPNSLIFLYPIFGRSKRLTSKSRERDNALHRASRLRGQVRRPVVRNRPAVLGTRKCLWTR